MCCATVVLTAINSRIITMINFLKKGVQIVNEELAQYEQLHINTENEYQAMSCGALNPKLLANIKKIKADINKNKD